MAEPARSNIPQTQGTQATNIEAARAQANQIDAELEQERKDKEETEAKLGYESDASAAYSRARTVDEQVKVIKSYFKEFAPKVTEDKINTLMPIIKREVDELGLSKYENPFIEFIEKYLINNSMTVPEYTALHNLYSQGIIDEEDVRGTYNKGNQKEATNTPIFNPNFYKHSYDDMEAYWKVWKKFRKPNEVKKELREHPILKISPKEQINDVANYFKDTKSESYKIIRNVILFQVSENEAGTVDIRTQPLRPIQVVKTLLAQLGTPADKANVRYSSDDDDDEEDNRNRDDGSFYAVGSIDNAMKGIDKMYQTNKSKVKNLYKYIVKAIDEIAQNDFSIRTKETPEYRQMVKENSTDRYPEVTAKIKSNLIQADYVKSNNYQRLTKEVIARYSPVANKRVKDEEGATQ